jgi:hypothetical protein
VRTIVPRLTCCYLSGVARRSSSSAISREAFIAIS